jgi:hypothetical protein
MTIMRGSTLRGMNPRTVTRCCGSHVNLRCVTAMAGCLLFFPIRPSSKAIFSFNDDLTGIPIPGGLAWTPGNFRSHLAGKSPVMEIIPEMIPGKLPGNKIVSRGDHHLDGQRAPSRAVRNRTPDLYPVRIDHHRNDPYAFFRQKESSHSSASQSLKYR